MLGERIASQSDLIRAIVSDYSPQLWWSRTEERQSGLSTSRSGRCCGMGAMVKRYALRTGADREPADCDSAIGDLCLPRPARQARDRQLRRRCGALLQRRREGRRCLKRRRVLLEACLSLRCPSALIFGALLRSSTLASPPLLSSLDLPALFSSPRRGAVRLRSRHPLVQPRKMPLGRIQSKSS